MPIKYVPYTPNTIEGQAILDNITRTRRVLRYRDNDRVYDRLRRGLPLFEVTKEETVGDPDKATQNLLLRGDCLSACAYLKDKGIAVDLVYIDPPFASGADYAKKVYLRRHPEKAQELANAAARLEMEELRAFEEKMYGDIWNKEDYLNWMYQNLQAIKSVMSDTGSIYVHLNYAIGHYVKVMMDEIFGEDNFENEIIWCYSERGISKTNWNRKHDTIYFYTKVKDAHYFNCDSVRDKYSEESEKKFKYWDEEIQDHYQIRGKNIQGSPVQSADGLLPEDEITYAGLTYRQYKGSGMLPKDWWEIPLVNKAANERVDYATQKPEALLERIIKASSPEGAVVADFFGGSGVTAKVACDWGRHFIHVDVGVNSIQTTRDRLKEKGASFELRDIQDGVSLFRNPVQTMNKLKTLISGLKNEDSLDEFWEGAIHDSKLGLVPVFLPNLLDHTTKVLDKPLLNRVLREALPDLPEGVNQVIVYYIDMDDPVALQKFIKDENPTDIEVELRDLKEVLDEVVLNDIVEYEAREANGAHEVEITGFISDRLQQKIDEYNAKKGLSTNRQIFDIDDEDEDEDTADDDEENISSKKRKFKPIQISEDGLELIEMVSLDCTASEGEWHSNVEIKIDKKGFVIRDGAKTKAFWDAKIQSSQKPLRLKVRNIAGDESIIALVQDLLP